MTMFKNIFISIWPNFIRIHYISRVLLQNIKLLIIGGNYYMNTFNKCKRITSQQWLKDKYLTWKSRYPTTLILHTF